MRAIEMKEQSPILAMEAIGEFTSLVWGYMLAMTAVSLLIFRKVNL
ncbi:MAG: hypothetical protein OEV92_11595 [Nitrospinota bacterium]|nr:hypothetical protein [Nitrospinota bacterium]